MAECLAHLCGNCHGRSRPGALGPNMLNKKITFVVLAVLCFLGGCTLRATTHNPVKEALAASIFLRTVYIDHDYVHAMQLAHDELQQSVGVDDLRQIAEEAQSKEGKVQTFTGESFLPTPGETIEVFFVGQHERQTLYHRLVLIGDESNGYKVSGVWFSTQPYAAHTERRRFSQPVLVE